MHWFTSDWHISHEGILKIRPFNTVKEMNDCILGHFCTCVNPGDTVYYLGDMAFKKDVIDRTLIFIKKLRINFIFVKGNHDRLPDYIKPKDILNKKINGQHITMCHFPMLSWEKSHYGAWMLHGHIHNKTLPKCYDAKRYNICVDQNYYKPVNFDQIKKIMSKLPNAWDYMEKKNG